MSCRASRTWRARGARDPHWVTLCIHLRHVQGYLSVAHYATYYELCQRHPEVPRLSAAQQEALALFAALAQSDKLRLDFVLQVRAGRGRRSAILDCSCEKWSVRSC